MDLFLHPLVAVVVLLGVLVFVHELGHYLVAKYFGIGVETFSIGFGPQIFSFKKGKTVYQLSCIPLGGFVKLAGALPVEEVPEEFIGSEMYKAPRWQRALVLFAGPLANIFLAISVYCLIGFAGIEHPAPIIGAVRQNSVAEKSGFLPGDQILSIEGKKIKTWREMHDHIAGSPGTVIKVDLLRKTKQLSINVRPEAVPVLSEFDLTDRKEKGRLGIGYGFIAPLITVLDKDSLAYKSGLRTGDKVLKVSPAQNSPQEIKISYWYEVQEYLFYAYLEKREAVHFTISRGKNIFSFDVDLYPSSFVVKSSEPLMSDLNAVSQQIGLTDSQLTLLKIQDGFKSPLQKGDKLISFAGNTLTDIYSLYDILLNFKQEKAKLSVMRDGSIIELNSNLKSIEQQRPSGKVITYTLPAQFYGETLYPKPVVERYSSIGACFSYALSTTYEQTIAVTSALGGLFTGKVPLQSLGGPILIAKVAGDSAKDGWQTFLRAMAIISINLGIVNLFPIPVLDGGQLVILFLNRFVEGL